MDNRANSKEGSPKILFFDIETMANLSYVWGKYEQNTIATHRHWYMLTFAYKWLGDKRTHVLSLPDFPLYKKDPTNDKQLVEALWKLFDEADVVVAHNGDQFDIKKTNARFLKHGLKPPTPYKKIDTKKVAKRYFRLDSNKLDDIGDYFGIGRKINTGGFELWLGCEAGDTRSWNLMCRYNKQDVVLLEKVYLKMLPYIDNHPNYNLLVGTTHSCPNCGHNHLQRRGYAMTRVSRRQRYQCTKCGAWSQGENIAR